MPSSGGSPHAACVQFRPFDARNGLITDELHAGHRPLYAFSVLNGRSASSQTLKATLGVRELVFEGALQRGERVSEVALADRLGVSRTPLRIALATLAHEGLLETLVGGGVG